MNGLRFAAAIALAGLQSLAPQAPLVLVQSIALPGVEGRIDHLAFDSVRGHLFVAALGNDTMEVLDTKSGAHLKRLAGFHEPQGIAAAADAGIIAVANGQGDGLQFLRADDFGLGAVIRLGDDSDNVRYDPSAKRFYVGYGSGAIAAVSLAGSRVAGDATLPGHPESFQLEQRGTRIFVNVPSADQVAVIDRTSLKVIGTWAVAGAKANYPMALDEANHRLFVGCRRPAKVLVFDTGSGQQIGAFDIVGDTDDLFYDAARKRLYVSGGEGYIDVLADQGANRFIRISRIATAAGARTALFVPDQSRFYLAVPHRGSQPAEVRVYEVR